MTAVLERSEAQIEIEEEGEYRLDLSGADLNGTDLYYAKLIRARLTAANLNCAYLFSANLTGANLKGANLTHATLENCKGLSREQLDEAVAREGSPPDLLIFA